MAFAISRTPLKTTVPQATNIQKIRKTFGAGGFGVGVRCLNSVFDVLGSGVRGFE